MSMMEFLKEQLKEHKTQWTEEAYEEYKKHTGKELTPEQHNDEVDAGKHDVQGVHNDK